MRPSGFKNCDLGSQLTIYNNVVQLTLLANGAMEFVLRDLHMIALFTFYGHVESRK